MNMDEWDWGIHDREYWQQQIDKHMARKLERINQNQMASEYSGEPAIAPNQRVSAPWPDINRGTTQQVIDQARAMGFLPPSIVAFASESEWRRLVGSQPPTEGSPKYWRSDTIVRGKDHLYIVVAQRDSSGRFVGISPVPTGYSYEDETFNFLGPTVTKYLQQHSKSIGMIPKLRLMKISAPGATRISFAPGISFDLPIAECIWDEGGPIEVKETGYGEIWAGPSQGSNPNNLRVGNRLDGKWFPRLVYPDHSTIEYCLCQGFLPNDATPAINYKYSDLELALTAGNIMGQKDNTLSVMGQKIREAALAVKP